MNTSKLLSALTVHTESLIESFHFFANHVGKIIKKLNPKKAPEHDMTSISILKVYGSSICKTWQIIFKNYLKESRFTDEWKNSNEVLIHKK